LGSVFLTDYGSDKWSAHHTITQSGPCKLQTDADFECGSPKAEDTTIEGTAKDPGKFHYEVTFAYRGAQRP